MCAKSDYFLIAQAFAKSNTSHILTKLDFHVGTPHPRVSRTIVGSAPTILQVILFKRIYTFNLQFRY